MWQFLVLACTGCNWVYGLDETQPAPPTTVDALPDASPFLDEDLDGILNADDNCPGVPNPMQENVLDLDPVGDVCDPNPGKTTTVVATLFFNTPADWSRFTREGDAFVLGDGYVEINPMTPPSYLHGVDRPAFTRGTLTIEAGFEVLAMTQGTRVGVYTDGPTVDYTWIEVRPPRIYLVVNNMPAPASSCDGMPATGCDEDAVLTLPRRAVIQQRAGSTGVGELKGSLVGSVDVHYDVQGTTENRYGIVVQSARARLHHVVVYSQD